MLTPAKRKNLYEEISSQIIKMVNEGEWKPGQKIPGEIELSKSLEVSRNSIRESLKALELTGILTSKPGKGTFVADQALANIKNMELASLIESESSLIELMETRLIIEPEMTYQAVKNSTEEDIQKLEASIKKQRDAINNKNYTFNIGFQFHKHIFSMAKNKILYNLLDSITDNLIETRKKVFFKHLSEYILHEELDEHIEILELFKNKDAEGAKDAMYKHIEKSLNLLKRSIMKERNESQ